jgi:hypothetical protein
MKLPLLVALVLLTTALSGCQSAKPEQATKAQVVAEQPPVTQPAEKTDTPITITPAPGGSASAKPGASPESLVDATDGVDEKEAQIVGAQYLRALREQKLGANFGSSTEAYSLANQVKVQGEWLLTYSRTSVGGQPSDAYAATIALDSKTGKQTRVTEAP